MRFAEGIAAQPEVLAASAASLRPALGRLPRPAPADVLLLLGIGASEYAVRSAAVVWREQRLRAFAVSASELKRPGRPYADRYVAVSESGRSTETVAALDRLSGATRIGLTNFPDSPLARVVERVLPLGSGPDSPVYTTGYTATLQALGLLGDTWSGQRHDWAALPALASEVLAAAQPVAERLAETFDRARLVDLVASGASGASAGEGALLLRESARLLTAGHETNNYLHGPMEPLEGQVACLVIGDGREVRLARDVSTLGCPTLLLTTRTDVPASAQLTVLTLPAAPAPLGQTVLQILPIQLLGWSIAQRRGLPVDGFRYHQDDTKLPVS